MRPTTPDPTWGQVLRRLAHEWGWVLGRIALVAIDGRIARWRRG